MSNLKDMPLNDLIELAKQDADHPACEIIINKFKGIVHGIVNKKDYFLPNGDRDDLIQEGIWGIWKAIRDFDVSKGEFEGFVKICVTRQLISAIKTATRKYNRPLNRRVSLDTSLPDNDNLTMMDIFGALNDVQDSMDFESLPPATQLILEETQAFYESKIDSKLSKTEKEIFALYVDSNSYKEIMDILGIENNKQIDNAIQRVKRKIKEIKLTEETKLRTKIN